VDPLEFSSSPSQGLFYGFVLWLLLISIKTNTNRYQGMAVDWVTIKHIHNPKASFLFHFQEQDENNNQGLPPRGHFSLARFNAISQQAGEQDHPKND
jgi:hypothetical protein